jgi:hypothetical protein
MPTGAGSYQELKDLFLQHHRNDDTEAMLALYYLEGASSKMRDLYRRSLPRPQEREIGTAEIADIGGDHWPGRDPFTLKPEKMMMVHFATTKSKGIQATARWFFIGQHQGRYYFTLPTGEDRPEPKADLATIESLVQEMTDILVLEISAQLHKDEYGLKDQTWTSAYIDERWDSDGTSISKFRVVLANGELFSRLRIPQPVGEIMHDIGSIKDEAFPKRWYGIKVTIHPDRSSQVEYDHNPECVDDPDFLDPD